MNDWNRVPCGRELRTPEEARTWYARYRLAGIAAGITDSKDVEVDVRLTRPPGWGTDGRPRYGVWVRPREVS